MSEPAQLHLQVEPDEEGERLDVLLAAHVGSRTTAQRLIDEGHVTVDGEPRAKRHLLSAGELVHVVIPPAVVPDAVADATFVIRFQDEHLLVVDKPAGVVVHPGNNNPLGTLVQALDGLVAGGSDPQRPGVVHRLDRETSGLLVMARDEQTHAALGRMIRERVVVREYLALVDGRPRARTGTIDAPLGRDRRVRTRMSTDTADPRDAVTDFEIERPFPASTLLRVRLRTGRTHQIRAHLKAIGHPICGDPDYGDAGRLGLRRQFLHATRLAFPHPVTAEPVEVVSELPDDLSAALARAPEERAGAARHH